MDTNQEVIMVAGITVVRAMDTAAVTRKDTEVVAEWEWVEWRSVQAQVS